MYLVLPLRFQGSSVQNYSSTYSLQCHLCTLGRLYELKQYSELQQFFFRVPLHHFVQLYIFKFGSFIFILCLAFKYYFTDLSIKVFLALI